MSTFEPCTLDDVADALNYLDFNHRDTWVQMAFAVKSEFGEGGFDTWEDWGSQYKGYNKSEARSVWKSAKAGGGITIKTLFGEARQNGYKPRELDAVERERLQREQAERSARVADEREEEEKRHNYMQGLVGGLANEVLHKYTGTVGRSKYLGRKHVGAYGVHFFKQAVLIVVDDKNAKAYCLDDRAEITRFFEMPKEQRAEQGLSIRYVKRGDIAIPLRNADGIICNIQIIFEGEKASKSFLKYGRKEGCYLLIGDFNPETGVDHILITEGYATGASLYEATGMPVAVAFDAGNLMKVGQQMRKFYPSHTLIFAGDDDWETEQETGKNPGREKANEAAKAVGGVVVIPKFTKAVA